MNKELGTNLTLEWQTPSWDLITAGSWGGRWDMSIGSMSVTKGREKVVDFADPYYYDFGSIAVPTDSTATSITDLDGKTICVGASTTYEQWLKGTLEHPRPEHGAAAEEREHHVAARRTTSASRRWPPAASSTRSSPTRTDLANAVAQNQPLKIMRLPPPFVVSVAFALDKSGAAHRRACSRCSTRSSPTCTPTAR